MDTNGYKGVLTCAFQVKDRQASIRWYQEAMGFELLYDMAEVGWCEMKTGIEGVTVGFSEVEKPRGRGGAVLTFGVKDIDAARSRLEKMKVRFDGPTIDIAGMVRLCTFFDPDGNALMFSQMLKGA